MQSDVINKLSTRSLVLAYCVGVALCLLTQLAVIMQHGSKIYVSLFWAPLYPIQLFITGASARTAIAIHLSLRDATARGIGITVSSALLGVIVPAVVGLARSSNRLARYVGIAALIIIFLSAVLWGPFPNAL
jgi:peptidoglycan/LPS O-acetylase OafA/YrhL